MEKTTMIPVVTTGESLKVLVKTNYSGLANVQLNKETVSYLLGLNIKNRKIKKHSVDAYVSSFQKFGYESIGLMLISDAGDLMDGQHRLTAVEQLFNRGMVIDAWQVVKFGVKSSRMVDIDNGVPRTLRDTLVLNNVVSDAKYATALRTFAIITSPQFRIKFTAAELEEIYNNEFKDVFEIGDFLSFPGSGIIGIRSYRPAPWVITAFRLCQMKYGTENMKKVYDQFYNCQDLGCPMAYFRNTLLTNKGKFRFSVQVTGETQRVLGLFFSAVQKCIVDERVKSHLRPTKLGLTIQGNEF